MTMITMQMNEADERGELVKNGFAFTFELPSVPAEGALVFVAQRCFEVAGVEWFPLTQWPVRLLAFERTDIAPDRVALRLS